MARKVTVMFWCMRHGNKSGDALTQNGIEQIKESAEKYLSTVIFTAAFSSGMERAKQTAMMVLATLRQNSISIMNEDGFGFAWAFNESEFKAAGEAVTHAKKQGEEETVALWLKHWRAANAIRGRFLGTMLGWARAHAVTTQPTRERINIFVATHNLVGEMAVLDPAGTPLLREAEICQYEIEVDLDDVTDVRLIASEVLGED